MSRPHGLEPAARLCPPTVRRLIGGGIAELRRAQIQQSALDRLRGRVECLGLERRVRCFGAAFPEEKRRGGDGGEKEQSKIRRAARLCMRRYYSIRLADVDVDRSM